MQFSCTMTPPHACYSRIIALDLRQLHMEFQTLAFKEPNPTSYYGITLMPLGLLFWTMAIGQRTYSQGQFDKSFGWKRIENMEIHASHDCHMQSDTKNQSKGVLTFKTVKSSLMPLEFRAEPQDFHHMADKQGQCRLFLGPNCVKRTPFNLQKTHCRAKIIAHALIMKVERP